MFLQELTGATIPARAEKCGLRLTYPAKEQTMTRLVARTIFLFTCFAASLPMRRLRR